MKPLSGGHDRQNAKDALQYVMALPFVDTIALGLQSIDEIRYAVSLFAGFTDDALGKKLAERTQRLHIADWCQGCGKCAARCQQKALRMENGKACVIEYKCLLCGYCAKDCPEFCIKVY